jgi:4-diphosphocytidyl-2-C-methyl-D-erythritol kinase
MGGTVSATESLLAPAKLNLFLHIVGRRADGYHLLQSVFVLLEMGDYLRFSPRQDGVIRRISRIPGVDEKDDLVVRAAELLKRTAKLESLGVDISIEKRIPMGAGLGGGSSDAATTLMALNRLWDLQIGPEPMATLGLSLGADVPFFLFGRNAFVEGIGERMQAVEVPRWWYLVLTPPTHVPTGAVFTHPELTRNSFPIRIADFSALQLRDCRNDMQTVVLKMFPEVATAYQALHAVCQKSIFGARMTGSGACVFAAFKLEQDAQDAFQQLQPKHQGFIASSR